MGRATLIVLEHAAIFIGAYLIAQHNGWQMGVAVGLIAWAILPIK